MAIATRINFDEAISLIRVRLRFQEDELKQGQVETVPPPLTGPWGVEGSCAIVYKFRSRSGSLRALRVFKKHLSSDIGERYKLVGEYLHTHASDISVDFRYHESGIRVKSADDTSLVFPLIDMEWIEGVTLLERVDKLCLNRDHEGLNELLARWTSVVDTMRRAHLAHGNLSGNDVIVRPDGRLVLVDYDSVFIPDLKGRHRILPGHPDYQHPQHKELPLSEEMDAFPTLVIYTALAALAVKPELWDSQVVHAATGQVLNDNLLIGREDFAAPYDSPTFKEIGKLGDPKVDAALQHLIQACLGPVDQVRFPSELGVTEVSDSRHSRIELARRRIAALSAFREALSSDDDDAILHVYDSILDDYATTTASERQRLDLARKRCTALRSFQQAIQADDDEQIAAAYDPILDGYARVIAAHHQRLALARRRLDALHRFRQALGSDNDESIIAGYAPELDRYPKITTAERQRLESARRREALLKRFHQALQTDDDEQIAQAYAQAYNPLLDSYPGLSRTDGQRIALAHIRLRALDRVREALQSGDERQIAAAYDPVLDGYPRLHPTELQQVEIARRCVALVAEVRQALQSDDDDRIVKAYDAKLLRLWMNFSPEEIQRIQLTHWRFQALQRFRTALQTDDDEQIVNAYDAILDSCPKVTPHERQRLDLARKRAEAVHRLRKALSSHDERSIAAAYDPVLDNYPKLHSSERQQVESAQRRIALPAEVREAILTGSDVHIIKAYDQVEKAYDDSSIHPWTGFTPQEIQRITLAQNRQAAYRRIQQALDSDDDDQIAATIAAYGSILQNYAGITHAHERRISLAQQRTQALQRLRWALLTHDERTIVGAYDHVLDNYGKISSAERREVELAFRCTKMPQQTREAVQTGDDERIVHVFDPTLIRPWMAFTAEDLRRIETAARRCFERALLRDDDSRILETYDLLVTVQLRITLIAKTSKESEPMTLIFLSYARADEPQVKPIYDKLRGAGYQPWLDQLDILPGEDWKLAIEKAIDGSDFFIACLSRNAIDRRGVLQRELKQALDLWQEKLEDDIYIIPARLEECPMPDRLQRFQWVNLFEPDGWSKLIQAIEAGLARR